MEKKDLNRSIGLRIKTARERAGLTQEQLAEQINRSTQFVSTIERGVAGPSVADTWHRTDAIRLYDCGKTEYTVQQSASYRRSNGDRPIASDAERMTARG